MATTAILYFCTKRRP